MSGGGPISRLLVANRGEIARRVIRTCRTLGISPVAVHSTVDSGGSWVAEADLAVELPGAAPADTYLRADLLVAAARRAGADAVHPGYGFLAEDAGFARAVLDAGLTWVGPPPAAIASMGSKVDAKALVAAAGVPVLSSWDPAAVPPDAAYPLLVKASYGGGGRGMRVVAGPGGLADAVAAATREAESAFGDGTVFLERWLEGARHIEVQVLADTHGTVLALGERDCSVQRRHQKIVEEAPAGLAAGLRAELHGAAVAAARSVGYVGAGTVEFLVDAAGTPAFLEMNTRLQVEHPVTEAVLGIDLVALQLLVAEGEPLPFDETPPVRGHAIEVRLYAEDPAADWRPSTGVLHRLAVPGVTDTFDGPGDGLRLDSGVVYGDVVSPHYDPMLAKLVAWAPTRAAAARRLAAALERAAIHGLATNRDLLVRVLRSDGFAAGPDTGFLAGNPGLLDPLAGPDEVRTAALAAALAAAARRRAARHRAGHPAGRLAEQPVPTGHRGVRGSTRDCGGDLPAGAGVRLGHAGRGRAGAGRRPGGVPGAHGRAGVPRGWSRVVGGAVRSGPAAGAGGGAGGRLADRADAGAGRRGAGGRGRPGRGRATAARAGGDEDGARRARPGGRRPDRAARHRRVPGGRRRPAGRHRGGLMDFTETVEQQQLRKAVAAVAARYGHPYWLGKARAGEKTDELWDEVGRLGYLGVGVPEEYGGGRAGHRRAGHRGRGAGCGRLPAAAHRGLAGHLRDDHREVRHHRAEGALAARAGLRRGEDGLRDHRAGRRLELAPTVHSGHPGRVGLGAERAQDVHLGGSTRRTRCWSWPGPRTPGPGRCDRRWRWSRPTRRDSNGP